MAAQDRARLPQGLSGWLPRVVHEVGERLLSVADCLLGGPQADGRDVRPETGGGIMKAAVDAAHRCLPLFVSGDGERADRNRHRTSTV
jgi:hypothetical protein